MELAAVCDRAVEVLDERDEFGEVYALPSGELKAEIGMEPVRAVDEVGLWAPIDTTLVVAGDGLIRPVNTTEDVVFSAGGAGPFASIDYGEAGSFALSWPDELPEPVVDGSHAVYEEILTGVDLVVEATAQGFRYDLVVADAVAAANPELEAIDFDITMTGGTVAAGETGAIEVNVAGETALSSAPAMMWEAPNGEGAADLVPALEAATDSATQADQEVAGVAVAVENDDLVLRPDLGLLRGEDTRYPVVIDPEFTGGIQNNLWGLVISRSDVAGSDFYQGKNNSGNYFMSNTSVLGNAGAGRVCDSWNELTCTSTEYLMRSFFRMDTASITQNDYRVPNRGVFKIIQRHSADCNNGVARVWLAGGYNPDDTWNNQPSWNEYVTTSSADHGAACGGSAYVSWNVTSMVNKAEDNEWANLTLGLRAADESPSPDLEQWNRFDASSAILEIYFDVTPYSVSSLELNGNTCGRPLSGRLPWITDRTPALSGLVRSEDTSVKWQLQVKESGSNETPVYEYTSGNLASNHRQSRTVPSNSQLGDGVYYWHARAISTSNSSFASPWSSPCRFKLDGTKPTTPTIAASVQPPYNADELFTLTASATDPLVNGAASRIVRFKYSWTTNTYDRTVSSTPVSAGSTTETASIGLDDVTEEVADETTGETATKFKPGRHVLYVKAVDAAGNESDEQAYSFMVGRDIDGIPKAVWRFEGDTLDDTSFNQDLTADTGSIAYTTDHSGRPSAALALDGQTCLATEGPVVHTHAAFSVSAWVRVDVAEDYDKVLVQAGAEHSAFQIQYSGADDKWYFSLLSSPGADFEWRSVGAPATAALGEWQHVAGTYDPDAGVTRIYVDGVLAGEMEVDFEPWDGQHPLGVGCLLNAAGDTSNFVTGAIDQVGVWEGLLTPEQVQQSMADLPSAAEQVHWSFRDDGTDTSGYNRHLTVPQGTPVGTDPYERPSGSVELDGETCLEYPEPVVDSERSFTIAAWARVDEFDSGGTIVSTLGPSYDSGFELAAWNSSDPYLLFYYKVDDSRSTSTKVANVSLGQWFHVAVVVDVPTGEIRTFLNGELVSTWEPTSFPLLPSQDSLKVGCSYYPDGSDAAVQNFELHGALHDVSLWRGPVDASQIAGMMGDPPAELAAWWEFNGWDGVATADSSGYSHELAFSDTVDLDPVGRDSQIDHALLFDGNGHAQTSEPVVATDESFTIATWVRPDDLTADGVAVSITGDSRSVITLKYSTANGAWEFAAPPTTYFNWRVAGAAAEPPAGEYTFLVGVFNLRLNELHLYINGVWAATAEDVVLPASTGPVVIGAESNADGTVRHGLVGAVDDTIVWQGAVSQTTIANIYGIDPETTES